TPKTVMKKPELLAPAGNVEKLKIAVHYGADAVFLGGQEYGLRSNANQSQVEAALSTVTTTKQALNGDRKVTDAKNNANQTLSTLDTLNNAQEGAVTGNINPAHTVAAVTQAIPTALELNTAMGTLK
ncbi:hypothetical protein, partial [Staphylococcus aureus]|uniref:hypothetical protein n=1 Tax=Staphylococcus aureus TaxID=1280 RepID=UPI00210CD4F3